MEPGTQIGVEASGHQCETAETQRGQRGMGLRKKMRGNVKRETSPGA